MRGEACRASQFKERLVFCLLLWCFGLALAYGAVPPIPPPSPLLQEESPRGSRGGPPSSAAQPLGRMPWQAPPYGCRHACPATPGAAPRAHPPAIPPLPLHRLPGAKMQFASRCPCMHACTQVERQVYARGCMAERRFPFELPHAAVPYCTVTCAPRQVRCDDGHS